MQDTTFAAELAQYGPQCRPARPPTLVEARAYCRRLARSHYENFTVVSWLLPRALRQHFYHVYAYCRWADDLADEAGSPAQSLELLDWWEGQLHECYRGQATHPVFVALAETIAEFQIPPQPFLDLLSAFRQDQRATRYETFAELLDYCRRSANPVGRLVLCLGRCHDEPRARLADSICTGLQLANFWQDVARDYRRGRIYLPQEDCRRAGCDEEAFARHESNAAFRTLLRGEVERAESFLVAGWPLVSQVPRALQLDVALFIRGGLAILDAIRRQDFDVWSKRPVVSKGQKLQLMVSEWTRVSFSNLSPLRGEGRVATEHGPRAWPERRAVVPHAALEDSYSLCQQLARRAASNFYFSFALLPRAKRRAMCALYAFLRRTDDLGDAPAGQGGADSGQRRAALEQWRTALRRALGGEFDDPILPAVAHTLGRYSIPPDYLSAVIDGVEMDLDGRQYETFDELTEYCHRVASVVGQACIHIWGFRAGRDALRLSEQCGIAFQMTNILRDIKEDADQGRVYLPQQDLRRFGYSVDELRHGVRNQRFSELMQFEIARAEQFYDEGAQLMQFLSRDGQRIFAAMLGAYRGLLAEIKRRPSEVLNSRIRLSRWKKLRIAAASLLRRS